MVRYDKKWQDLTINLRFDEKWRQMTRNDEKWREKTRCGLGGPYQTHIYKFSTQFWLESAGLLMRKRTKTDICNLHYVQTTNRKIILNFKQVWKHEIEF